MAMMHAIGAVSKWPTYLENHCSYDFAESKLRNVEVITALGRPFCQSRVCSSEGLHKYCFSRQGWKRPKGHFTWHGIASKRWLCQSRDVVTSDDEYRSSRNIAISLFRRYRNVIDRGGNDTLKEFIGAGVNAYSLGCTDEGLRKELNSMKDAGIEIKAIESSGSRMRLRSKMATEEVDECILWVSIIFITILCTPQPTIVRWSSTPPVSDDVLLQWKGFCAIIANAYFMRGMAWLPVKTLQLEQMAVLGHAEEPAVVASRMRLVFSTLEVVSPQWPRA